MDSLKSSAAYKRIDTIPKLLEYMWSLFPNIIAIKMVLKNLHPF